MEKKTVESLFELAGLEILSIHKLWNQYYPNIDLERDRHVIDWCIENPWWLIETRYGLITIGWRKRVVEINWERTKLRKKVTEDADVTSELTYVHAWTQLKQVEYLTQLAFELLWLDAHPEPVN